MRPEQLHNQRQNDTTDLSETRSPGQKTLHMIYFYFFFLIIIIFFKNLHCHGIYAIIARFPKFIRAFAARQSHLFHRNAEGGGGWTPEKKRFRNDAPCRLLPTPSTGVALGAAVSPGGGWVPGASGAPRSSPGETPPPPPAPVAPSRPLRWVAPGSGKWRLRPRLTCRGRADRDTPPPPPPPPPEPAAPRLRPQPASFSSRAGAGPF